MQENREKDLEQHLTEDSIRQIALRFLKTYYKFRPREGETTAGYNLTTNGGLVVDGYLSFKNSDGSPFLATLEATSHQKRKEIKYTLQSRILFWDALAVGSLAGAFLYSYGYKYNHFTVNQLGIWGSLGVIFLTILSVFLLFRLVSKGFSRYRYIYAVEQFKRYKADEQWIAMGEDVFDNPSDKQLIELKNQCVYNGFGLVMIDKNFEPHLMITPARKEVVKGRKQIFKSFSDNKIREAIRKSPLEKVWTKIKAPFKKIGGQSQKTIDTNNLMRFRPKFWRQAAVVLVSFGLLTFILERELVDADIIHVDTKVYQEEMEKININTRPEPQDYIVDTSDITTTFDLEENLDGHKFRIKEDERQTVDFQENRIPKGDLIKTEEIAIFHKGSFIYYSCDRFFGFEGQKYVVTDGIFPTLPAAEHRIRQLAKAEINAHAFWVGCFDKAKGYVIYYDQIYNERDIAERSVDSFFKQFKAKRMEQGLLQIMVLER